MHLGIIGAPGAGKDAIANFLVETKGYKRIAFADKIKQGYYEISGFFEEQFKNERGEAIEDHIRDGLWAYSSKMKDQYGSDYFIDPVIKDIKESKAPIVLTDIRTSEELSKVQNTDFGVKFQIFIVVRNYKNELSSTNLLGTRLPLYEIMGKYPILWNDIEGLDHAHLEFEKFYNKLKRGFILN